MHRRLGSRRPLTSRPPTDALAATKYRTLDVPDRRTAVRRARGLELLAP